MKHFLLPPAKKVSDNVDVQLYGVHLMEVLVSGSPKIGADRARLKAKAFDGANLVVGLSNVGLWNVDFEISFLEYEGIGFADGDTGGKRSRCIQYWHCFSACPTACCLKLRESGCGTCEKYVCL